MILVTSLPGCSNKNCIVSVGASPLIAITVTSKAFEVDAEGLLPLAISALTAFTSGVVFQNDGSKRTFFCCALDNKETAKAKEIKKIFFITIFIKRDECVCILPINYSLNFCQYRAIKP